jgi:hypothetical protein
VNKLLLLIFLSLNLTAQVVDPNEFIKAIQDKHMNMKYDQCKDCQENSDVYLCVESLCGQANPSKSAFVTGENLEGMYNASIENQFKRDKDLIKDSFEKSAYFSEELLKEMKKRNLKIEMTSKERSSFIAKSIIPHLDVTLTEDNKINIAYDKMNKLSTGEKNFMKEFTNRLKTYSKDSFQIKYDLGLPLEIDDIRAEIERLENAINDKSTDNAQLKQLQQALKWIESKTSKYNPSPKYIHQTATFLTNIRAQILPLVNLDAYPDMCQGLSCTTFIKNQILPKKREKLKSYERMVQKIDDKKINQLTNKCLGAYYFDELEAKYMDTMNFTIDGRQRVLDYIQNDYSSDTHKFIRNYINIDMNLKTDNKDVFNQDDVDKIKEIAQNDRQLKVQAVDKLAGISDYELLSNFDNQFYYTKPVLSQLQMFCSSDMSEIMPIINDHYQPVFDKVKLSKFTCSHPNIGQDIFAHELGHVVSELLSRGNTSDESLAKFRKRRRCVSSLYNLPDYQGSHSKSHAYDHFRSEEDMADFFSAQVSNYNRDTKGISMCALLPVVNGAYSEIQVENRSYDNHSSAFIRIIREAHFKGVELGPNCQKVINKNKHLWNFKNCK